MRESNFSDLLGGVERDVHGRIVSARAAMFLFWGKMNGSRAKMEGVGLENALGEYVRTIRKFGKKHQPLVVPCCIPHLQVDSDTLAFEAEVIRVLSNASAEVASSDDGVKIFVNVARSFNDIASAAIFTDVSKVVAGFAIVFTYVVLMLGDFSMVKNRAFLSLCGLGSVFLAMAASAGICHTLGYPHSPLHNFIPFLLMGLGMRVHFRKEKRWANAFFNTGIDDMFVIMESWRNLPPQPDGGNIPDRFGRTMRKAGVAITVTSLTDVVSFVVGSTTVRTPETFASSLLNFFAFQILPALRSFCVFCATGIFIVYLLQATYFVAWMTIDQVILKK